MEHDDKNIGDPGWHHRPLFWHLREDFPKPPPPPDPMKAWHEAEKKRADDIRLAENTKATQERERAYQAELRNKRRVESLRPTNWIIVCVVLLVGVAYLGPKAITALRPVPYDPQGTGPFNNKTYTADEVDRFYSESSNKGKILQLVGNKITVDGDIRGANIIGMGDMTFTGDVRDSRITDIYGLITVRNIRDSALKGNDIHVLGNAVNTTKTIQGEFPNKRRYSTK